MHKCTVLHIPPPGAAADQSSLYGSVSEGEEKKLKLWYEPARGTNTDTHVRLHTKGENMRTHNTPHQSHRIPKAIQCPSLLSSALALALTAAPKQLQRWWLQQPAALRNLTSRT